MVGTVAFLQYGFWWWALFVQCRAHRKYRPGAYPTVGNMAHNMWYWALGWALWECAMTRLCATGRVPYVSDAELLRSPAQLLATALIVLAVPVWREHHFYFVHRFSHIRALYRYVHSLHHRNADTEPFSGLCMHLVEHLLYFSNSMTPVLYLRCSPLVFTYMFVHLCMPPAAAHSGFEDHWHSDQFHYIHHASFECSYGAPLSAWLDIACGTFREKLGRSAEYRGAHRGEGVEKMGSEAVFSAQSYLGLQKLDHMAYTLFCLATAALTALSVWRAGAGLPAIVPARAVRAFVAFGPVVFAALLSARCDSMSWR